VEVFISEQPGAVALFEGLSDELFISTRCLMVSNWFVDGSEVSFL
jgi:hypothetical protein